MDAPELADRILQEAKGKSRFLVALAGPPGAGKSTLADALCAELNSRGEQARSIPMDGFHLDNKILDQRDLRSRKGAPQTFDADGFVHMIGRLKSATGDIAIPLFDREQDIAIAGADIVTQGDRFLVVEGNYLLLQSEPWAQLVGYWDLSVFLNPGARVIEYRLIKRWLGLGRDAKTARQWVTDNDMPNAHTVLESSTEADVLIP